MRPQCFYTELIRCFQQPKPGVELTLYGEISLQPDNGPLLKGRALTVLNYGYDPKSRLKKNVIC